MYSVTFSILTTSILFAARFVPLCVWKIRNFASKTVREKGSVAMKLVAYASRPRIRTGSPRRGVQYLGHNRDANGNRRNMNNRRAVLLLLPITSERATENSSCFPGNLRLASMTPLASRLGGGSRGKKLQQLVVRSHLIRFEPPTRFFAFPCDLFASADDIRVAGLSERWSFRNAMSTECSVKVRDPPVVRLRPPFVDFVRYVRSRISRVYLEYRRYEEESREEE